MYILLYDMHWRAALSVGVVIIYAMDGEVDYMGTYTQDTMDTIGYGACLTLGNTISGTQ